MYNNFWWKYLIRAISTTLWDLKMPQSVGCWICLYIMSFQLWYLIMSLMLVTWCYHILFQTLACFVSLLHCNMGTSVFYACVTYYIYLTLCAWVFDLCYSFALGFVVGDCNGLSSLIYWVWLIVLVVST